MTAVDDDGHGPRLQEPAKRDNSAPLVRKVERRKKIADPRRARAYVSLLQSIDQPVHGVGERSADRPYGRRKRVEPLAERGVHVAAFQKSCANPTGEGSHRACSAEISRTTLRIDPQLQFNAFFSWRPGLVYEPIFAALASKPVPIRWRRSV